MQGCPSFLGGMKCRKTKSQKSLFIKNDEMSNGAQAGTSGLEYEPKGPAGLEDGKEVY